MQITTIDTIMVNNVSNPENTPYLIDYYNEICDKETMGIVN